MHSPRSLLVLLLGASTATPGPTTEEKRVRARWVVALLIVGIVLDLLIGLAIGAIAIQAKRASSSAHISRVASYEACLRANDFRRADAQRWNVILDLSARGPQTLERRQALATIQAAVAAADSPADCGTLLP